MTPPSPGETAEPAPTGRAAAPQSGAESSAQLADWLLRAGVTALLIGLAASYVHGRAPRPWLPGATPPSGVTGDLGLYVWAGAIAMFGVVQLWPRQRWALALGCLVTLLHAIATARLAATPWLSVVSGATRTLAPLLAWCATRRSSCTVPWLRCAVAATFAGHGIQALQTEPRFVALLDASASLIGLGLDASTNAAILRTIGCADLTCAALTLLGAPRAVLQFMTTWGFATAATRLVHGGLTAWPEFAMRLVHGCAPWALLRLRR